MRYARLGPGFVKFAQIAASREDLLPELVCRSLRRLHSDVPPMARRDVLRQLAKGYGAGSASPFASIDPYPLGSGSIACVYRARTRDGQDVALKIRRPGIEARLARDVRLIAAAAGVAAAAPPLRRMPVLDVVRTIGDVVLQQADLARERSALATLRDDFRLYPEIQVPEVHDELSTDDALVMTRVPDIVRWDEFESVVPADRREALGRVLMDAVFRMLFVSRRVHCDMHPGNLVLCRDGTMALLDAGFTYEVSPAVQRSLASFFLNLSLGNAEGCAVAVLAGSRPRSMSVAERDDFADLVAALVARFGSVPSSEFDYLAFARSMFALQRACGVYFLPDFAFPLLSLFLVDPVVARLAPNLDFQALARPHVLHAMLRDDG